MYRIVLGRVLSTFQLVTLSIAMACFQVVTALYRSSGNKSLLFDVCVELLKSIEKLITPTWLPYFLTRFLVNGLCFANKASHKKIHLFFKCGEVCCKN